MVTYLGSLVQSCCGEGGTWQTNIAGMCGESPQCLGHTGFAPAHGRVCFPGLHCSGSRFLCRGTVQSGPWVSFTSQVSAPQVQVLGYSTKAQTRLGLRFVSFPGPSSSGDQVLGKRTLPGWGCVLWPPPSSPSVSWVLSGSAISGVPCESSGELISGCDPPGGCQLYRIPRSLG